MPSPSTASTLPGGKLAYTATAGTFSLFDQSGERSAAIFYTAYVAKRRQPRSRPVTFVFNGGPGAASAFLHLGLVGPRLAQFGVTRTRRRRTSAWSTIRTPGSPSPIWS